MSESPEKFYLRVTAGSDYASHKPVAVNSNDPLTVETPSATISLLVRIQDFRGPSSESKAPRTSPYFQEQGRTSARYSISFRLRPKKRINGNSIVLGNDFDQPITQYLPPFFGSALSVVKRFLDPGIDGDPYAEKPYLYGPVLSSVNAFRIVKSPDASKDDEFGKHAITEGPRGPEAEKQWKEEWKIPETVNARAAFFLDKKNRDDFWFEPGWEYEFDFFNGYLDFNGMFLTIERTQLIETEFSLKLPMGISFNILRQMETTDIPPLR
jgi:hypothetical protein